MKHFPTRTTVALAALAALSGCTGTPDILLGGDTTFDEAAAVNDALVARVDNVFTSQGATPYADLPLSGTPTYDGIIEGTANGGAGVAPPDISYFADLTLTADFSDDTISGTIKNMVTDLDGFEDPTGSATVTGSISNSGDDAALDFTANGAFAQGGAIAAYSVVSTTGLFGGAAYQVVSGSHETDFLWTDGPDVGSTSWSDGGWNAER